MISGIVPTFIVYGLKVIHPAIFLISCADTFGGIMVGGGMVDIIAGVPCGAECFP